VFTFLILKYNRLEGPKLELSTTKVVSQSILQVAYTWSTADRSTAVSSSGAAEVIKGMSRRDALYHLASLGRRLILRCVDGQKPGLAEA
jgi:hypothetical protein